MIIAVRQNLIESTRREILSLVSSYNLLLEDYHSTGLPEVKAKDLEEFGKDPVAYFNLRILEQAKEKGLGEVVPGEYAKLMGIHFSPNPSKYSFNPKLLNFVKFKEGKVITIPKMDEQLKEQFTIRTSNQEQEAAAKFLYGVFSNFTYLNTILYGGASIKTAGLEKVGLSPFHPGQFTLELVEKVAEGLKRIPKEEFQTRLAKQFKNPGFLFSDTAN